MTLQPNHFSWMNVSLLSFHEWMFFFLEVDELHFDFDVCVNAYSLKYLHKQTSWAPFELHIILLCFEHVQSKSSLRQVVLPVPLFSAWKDWWRFEWRRHNLMNELTQGCERQPDSQQCHNKWAADQGFLWLLQDLTMSVTMHAHASPRIEGVAKSGWSLVLQSMSRYAHWLPR